MAAANRALRIAAHNAQEKLGCQEFARKISRLDRLSLAYVCGKKTG